MTTAEIKAALKALAIKRAELTRDLAKSIEADRHAELLAETARIEARELRACRALLRHQKSGDTDRAERARQRIEECHIALGWEY